MFLTNASLYGKGVFTTIAVRDGKPFLWDKHWRRMSDNASQLNIGLDEFSEHLVKKSLADVLSENMITNGRARITFFDETESKIWREGTVTRTSLSIITGDQRPITDNFRLTISPYQVNSRSPLTGIKSCSYLDKIMALDEARNRGVNEAIQVNESGEITSAAMANVFWLKGDTLYTPSLKTGCLPGTTREFVMENMDCREVEDPIEKLHSADAIFLTSAGLGVVKVAEVEGRTMSPVSHPILDLLSNKN